MNKIISNHEYKRSINEMLQWAGWDINDPSQVVMDYKLENELFGPDYVLLDREKKPIAIVEAKGECINPYQIKNQVLLYAQKLGVPFIFYTVDKAIYLWDYLRDDAHIISTFFSREDLERIMYMNNNKTQMSSIKINDGMYPFHKNAIKQFSETVDRGKRKFIIEMPIGVGRTYLMSQFINTLTKTNNARNILILVDILPLAIQMKQRLYSTLHEFTSINLLKSDNYFLGRNFTNEKQIIISTFQTMANQYNRFTAAYFDTIITFDYFSVTRKGRYSILNHFDAFHISFSSTPVEYYNEKVDFKYTFEEAINDGYLVPYRIYCVNFEEQPGVQSNFLELENVLVNEDVSRTMMVEFDKLAWQEFRKLASGTLDGPGKGIVFAVNKNHANILANHLNQLHPEYQGKYAAVITSDIPNVNEIINKFNNESYPKILVNVNMRTIGLDSPEILHIAICKKVKSRAQYYQILTRGSRKATRIDKRAFAVYDFLNNYYCLDGFSFSESRKEINFPHVGLKDEEIKKNKYKQDVYIEVGLNGEMIEKDKYIIKWEQLIKEAVKSDPIIQKVEKGIVLTDKEEEELRIKLNQSQWYFNEENLGQAYDKQGDTIEQFIKVALGKSRYKTEEEELSERFSIWIMSKKFSSTQSQYLLTLKNIGLNRGEITENILLEPQFLLLNVIELGKTLFGDKGFNEVINEMNNLFFNSMEQDIPFTF